MSSARVAERGTSTLLPSSLCSWPSCLHLYLVFVCTLQVHGSDCIPLSCMRPCSSPAVNGSWQGHVSPGVLFVPLFLLLFHMFLFQVVPLFWISTTGMTLCCVWRNTQLCQLQKCKSPLLCDIEFFLLIILHFIELETPICRSMILSKLCVQDLVFSCKTI